MARRVLEGGRRRRRAGPLIALLALLLAPAAVGAAVWLAFERDGGGSTPPLAAGAPPSPARSPADPVVPEEPTATVRLDGVDAFSVRLRRPPRAGLVFDLDSGEVLWRRAALQVLPIASLTKIMTALLVAERTRPRAPVRITPAALRYTGSGVGVLPKGKRVRLETLMNGLLIVSGNDAAIALAVHVAGSERRFVRLMNRRARALGLRCTRFASSHGLESGNRSCAADLAALTRLAMDRRRIRRIARRRQAAFRFPIKGGKLYLTGHNPLQRIGYPGTLGLKTGYTNEAGRCFVGVARRGGRRLGVVLLNSFDPARQAPRLLDLGFRFG
jgi:serine-type D-Ala-D-Ala carboxypeptidase (penicillin-binding protein 5/6)